jgi:mannose-6-phosphate isomerase-like protein (cupin superfamily)
MKKTHQVTVEEALRQLESSSGSRSIELFRHGTLIVKMYAPRGTDPQTPHVQDEVYVVASGSGWFFNGAERVRFVPGDFLFAAAGQPHRFEEFSDDFAVWVLFYGPDGGEAP